MCDPDQDWQITGLIIDSIGSTLIPDSVVSTFSVDSKFIAQVNPNQVKCSTMLTKLPAHCKPVSRDAKIREEEENKKAQTLKHSSLVPQTTVCSPLSGQVILREEAVLEAEQLSCGIEEAFRTPSLLKEMNYQRSLNRTRQHNRSPPRLQGIYICTLEHLFLFLVLLTLCYAVSTSTYNSRSTSVPLSREQR